MRDIIAAMTIAEEIRRDPQLGAKRLESEYRAGLTTLARRLCHDPGDAAELVNRTFAEAIANIDTYAEQSAFFAWISKILVNLNAKEKRRESNQTVTYPGIVPDVIDEDAQEAIYANLDASLLRDAISELPAEMRDVVVMRYFIDLPLSRIAKILSVPEGTVNSRLHNAKLALAAKLGVAADKAKDAVKKPGVKATLVVLALCALTAAGAAGIARWGELSERAAAGETASEGLDGQVGLEGLEPKSSLSSLTSLPLPSLPSPSSPSSPSSPPQSSLSSGDNMNTTTLRTLAASAAFAAATAASGQTVAYWDFGSSADGTADASGNWNELKNVGVVFDGGAAVFDGVAAKTFHSRRPISLSESSAYTIECFVKSPTRHSGMILELSDNYYAAAGGLMLYTSDGAAVRTSNSYRLRKFTTDIFDNQWHHIAIVVNPNGADQSEQLIFYVDGTPQTSSAGGGTGMALKANRLFIGSRGDASLPFNGQIDDVRITQGALDPSDFHTTRTGDTFPVVAWWKFDDAAPLADASSNFNTLVGDTGVSFANGYASFNGAASNVRTSDTLDLSATSNLTVECFVRLHGGSTAAGFILEHSANYWENPQGFYLSVNDDRVGGLRGNVKFASQYAFGISPAGVLNAGWHHVAFVKDASKAGSADCVSLYVDGVRQTEHRAHGTASDGLMRNDYLYIGSRANSSLFLDADIDDIRVTAAALQPWQFVRERTGDAVIAYWPFKQKDMFADASGNGYALAGSGVVSRDGAVVLDGSQTGFGTQESISWYPAKSMTIEWFMKSANTSSTAIILESSSDYNANNGAFAAYTSAGTTWMDAGFRMVNGANLFRDESALDGNWHHYALIYDWDEATENVVKLYRDYSAVTVQSQSRTGTSGLFPAPIYIGSRAGTSLKFTGELDDIRVTGRVLDPSEFMTARSVPEAFQIIFR